MVNAIIQIIAVVYWYKVSFDARIFWIGLASGLFESLGKTCIQTAIAIGLAGPASAISSVGGVELVIYEAIKNGRMITFIETVALILSFIGSVTLVVPNAVKKIFCPCWVNREREQKKKVDEVQEKLQNI